MPLICKDCENKTRFQKNEWGTVNYNTVSYYNENEEWVNDSGYDYGDSNMDGRDDYTCNLCDSNNIKDVTQGEWEAWEGPDKKPKTWQERYKKK